MPADSVLRTFEVYNEKERRGRLPISHPPFYALGPVRSYVVFTEGGLQISDQFAVLANGQPKPGLYAVGAVGQGGLLLEGHGHHLDWAFISGRLAGGLCAQLPRQ